MFYQNFQKYLNLINCIKDVNAKNMSKEDVFYLIYKLCDEVEETAFNEAKKVALTESQEKGYELGHKDGYNDGHIDGYCAGYGEGWYTDCVLKKKKIVVAATNVKKVESTANHSNNYKSGYDNGYNDGYQDGSKDGYDRGYSDSCQDYHARKESCKNAAALNN